jgi:hypothetical protein
MYEIAIIQRQPMRVSWLGARGVPRVEALRLVKLRTHRHAEYMIAYNRAGQRRVLRLDRVYSARSLNKPARY